MPITTTRATTSFSKIVERYHYLGAILDGISFQPDIQTADSILTLKYKDGKYELIKVANDVRDVMAILEAKNLELQPKRGGPASNYHV